MGGKSGIVLIFDSFFLISAPPALIFPGQKLLRASATQRPQRLVRPVSPLKDSPLPSRLHCCILLAMDGEGGSSVEPGLHVDFPVAPMACFPAPLAIIACPSKKQTAGFFAEGSYLSRSAASESGKMFEGKSRSLVFSRSSLLRTP